MSDEYGLGRIHIPDERDANYPMAAVLPAAPSRTHRYWDAGWRGNQNTVRDPDGVVRSKPWCVAYETFHVLEMMGRPGNPDVWDPAWVYHEAQKIDQWPAENYDGTSVRAGWDVMRREGAVREYRHARTVDEIITAVLEHGPVGMGTKWTRAMFRPQDHDGYLVPDGPVVGGHAWVLSGVNVKHGLFRMTNSWGKGWADKGNASVTFDVLEELFEDDGDAVIAVLP